MRNTVILDFMGVIVDFDYLKLIRETSLKEKLTSCRLIFRLSSIYQLKNIFKMYKSGEINQAQLTKQLCGKDEKLKDLFSSVFKRIPEYITPNPDVIHRIRELKKLGINVIILSNTIPETESIIKELKLEDICDDIVCSTQVGITKPNLEIFKYVIEKNNLDPIQTIYVDDSQKNLDAAESLGLQTIHSIGTEDTCNILDAYVTYLDVYQSQL